MEKLLIFPGDWDILKNFQPILMKMYYAAGLKEMAQPSGFQGETLTSLEKCSNFKRTHQFLKQSWEAVYSYMIKLFISTELSDSEQSLANEVISQNTSNLQSIQASLSSLQLKNRFDKFIQTMSDKDNTWKLWANFAFRDCHAYMCLHSAIRTSNWNLRISSLKRMTPLLFAFDRAHYEKILPHHFADLLKFPKHIIECFKSGGFTVSIRGSRGHCIALDEAHEMCINKDLKGAVVQATDSRRPCSFLTE